MGKSGGRRKKGGGHSSVSGDLSSGNGGAAAAAAAVDLDSLIFLKKAHELKEEGNKRFQSKDYVGALEQYDHALRLTSKSHPDRAVLHSNRAACLMQMKPVQYQAVIAECSLALQIQPRYTRALLRRARALEALGKFEMAMQDVQSLLIADPNHQDALEIARRLRVALGPRQEAQQDLQSRTTLPLSYSSSSYAGTSPAALGASAVRGAPIGGLGPCLPARPVPKKTSNKPEKPLPDDQPCVQSNGPDSPLPKLQAKIASAPPAEPIVLKLAKDPSKPRLQTKDKDLVPSPARKKSDTVVGGRWRPLKLVYDHDIRLAQMPANCSFRLLRDIVSTRFPSSKSVLIKYRDMDGDLVTITGTQELRLAESCVDRLAPKKGPDDGKPEGSEAIKVINSTENGSGSALELLRLHIVEVSSEQEPSVEEDEKSIQDALVEEEETKGDDSASRSSIGDCVSEGVDNEIVKAGAEVEAPQSKKDDENNQVDCKEVEIDDWLFEFAQLFRTHVGIDPDAHVDLHELGMELCSEALEETVTSEEAQSLFDMASCKFQEVAALAFFNWGNVHMCAARKRIPLDESSPKEVITKQLQAAYDWVHDRYSLAGQKYEEALRIKPDFYEGLLALGQQHFETAKLRWSFALANKVDLGEWDSSETIKLFDSAEEKMNAATEMWEKLEEQRNNEMKDPSAIKKEELLLKRRKKHAAGADGQPPPGEPSADEAAEQATVMRSQIHLFWGNMLFERSQVEFKLGLANWKKNLDAAVKRFKLAGASETDISVVLKNHSSNVVAAEGDVKKLVDLRTDVAETNVEDEVAKHFPL